MALKRVQIPSPNYSSRSASVRLIVLHTAEGATTYQSLGSFFASRSSGVSSHVGIDDTPGTVGEYVPRSASAWTQASYNSQAVAAELCAFASWSPQTWATHQQMLNNCAAWVAEEAAAFGIPIVRLTPGQAQDGRSRGVCQHVDLGAGGGNHSDCGPGFPMDQVLAMATGSAGPTPTTKEVDMFLAYATTDASTGDLTIKKNMQYIVKESGVSLVATTADSQALQAKLGGIVGLTGNQINALK